MNWTPEDIANLRRLRRVGMCTANCAHILRRPKADVEHMLARLGEKTGHGTPWSTEELRILAEDFHAGEPASATAKRLGRSVGSVSAKRLAAGFRRRAA